MGLFELVTQGVAEVGNGVLATFGFGMPGGGAARVDGRAPASLNSVPPGPPLPGESATAEPKTRATLPSENRYRRTAINKQNRFRRLRAVARGYPAASSSVKELVRAVRNSRIEVAMADAKAIPTEMDLAAIADVKRFLRKPDPRNQHTIKRWLSWGEREVAEIGVFAFWPWRYLDGSLYGLVVVDGATIIPLKDLHGSLPSEGPAFSQELNGRVWWNFKVGEIFYEFADPLADDMFPRSATEDALGALTTAMLELIAQQDVAERHGHLTIFLKGASGQDAEKLGELANAVELEVNKKLPVSGGVVSIVPLLNGTDITPLPGLSFDIDREEFRIRMIRQAYGLSPTVNVRDNNRGTADSQSNVEEQTVIDRHEWWSELLTGIAQDLMGYTQLEVRLTPKRERDPLAVADANAAALAAGYVDVDEVRKEEGLNDNPALQAAFMARIAAPRPVNPFGGPPMPSAGGAAPMPASAAVAVPPADLVAAKAATPPTPTLDGVLGKLAAVRTEALQIEAARLLAEKKKAADGGK